MLSIEVKGARELMTRLDKMSKFDRLNMKEASIRAASDVIDHFHQSRSPNGTWKPVQRGGKPLQDTGRLMQSIKNTYSKFTAVVKTNVIYAKIHNFGGMAGRGRKVEITARKFMWLSKKAREAILNIIKKSAVPR
jgi:phage virion morphogenesis protein